VNTSAADTERVKNECKNELSNFVSECTLGIVIRVALFVCIGPAAMGFVKIKILFNNINKCYLVVQSFQKSYNVRSSSYCSGNSGVVIFRQFKSTFIS